MYRQSLDKHRSWVYLLTGWRSCSFLQIIHMLGLFCASFSLLIFLLLGLTRNNNGPSSSRWKPGATVAGMFFMLSSSLLLFQDHFVWNLRQLTGFETIKLVIKIWSCENSFFVNICLKGEAETFISWLVDLFSPQGHHLIWYWILCFGTSSYCNTIVLY